MQENAALKEENTRLAEEAKQKQQVIDQLLAQDNANFTSMTTVSADYNSLLLFYNQDVMPM